MALALLELTETPAGEVLEQLLVTSSAEAAADRHRALHGAINRVRLFAQIGGELTGVPRRIRVQLDTAAWASLGQLAQRRRAQRILSSPYMALWHHGQLQELQSQSLAESLEVWQRLAGAGDDSVLIELSDPAPTDAVDLQLARFYSYLSTTFLPPARRPQDLAAPRTTSAPEPGAAGTRARSETPSPAQQLLQDAAVQRQALAAQWLTAAQASGLLGSQATNGSHRASQLRRDGQLLGVYVSSPSPSYRYPAWQFHRPSENRPSEPVYLLPDILRVLRESGPFEREPDGLRRTTGWGEVEWFLTPHALLDGAAPADVLQVEPERVLQAARTEFEEEA